MSVQFRWIGLALCVAALTGCQQGEIAINNVTTPDGPTEPTPEVVIEPKVPTSMDDCDGEVFAGQAPMRLLTRYEYDYTVRDLLGFETRMGRDTFPPENSVAGFENNSDSHNVSPLLVRKLMEAAEGLSQQALSRKDALVGCDVAEATCRDTFLDDFLLRAFRRPPTDAEKVAFLGVYDAIAEVDGPDAGFTALIELALQSPQFLYRIELKDDRTAGELVPLGGYEVANRLSYFLWGSMPDAELFAAAASDALSTPEQVETHVRRMLADPRARDLVHHFYRQWLGLDALETMVKDSNTYPDWTPGMIDGWRASLNAFIDDVHFGEDGTLSDLMRSPELFLNDDLATLYGYTPNGTGNYVAPQDERSGLLTQPAVMALLAYPTQGSPIHRGIFVRERLLCQKLPPPPNNIQIEPPDPDPNATTRQVFEQHSKDDGCAGCHALIDPIGLGFENYDGIGRYRTVENGQAVDATGALSNTADPTIGGRFDGAVELSAMLAEAREVQDCVADHWFTFANGHPELESEMCAADAIRERFAASSGSFDDLVVAIATSDAFRYRTVQVPAREE